MLQRSVTLMLPASLLATLLLVPRSPAAELDNKEIKAIVQQAMKDWKVPGAALAVVKDDKVIYLTTFGVREQGKEEPVNPDTLFAIASCTKAFTAAALGVLVDEGKVSWDDRVRKHLPYFQLADLLADRDVTLRDLLCHRSGLSRHDALWSWTDLSRKEIVRRLAYLEPEDSFRSVFRYNNAYIAAGTAAGACYGGTWEELVNERLFKPLGMKGATCDPRAAEKNPNHVSRHNKDKEGVIAVRPALQLDSVGPTGSIHASISDMCKWVRFQLGDFNWANGCVFNCASGCVFNWAMTPPLGSARQPPETLSLRHLRGQVETR
jgi:CubicO group peptidase (beta-lactamase class C family)